MRYLKPSTLAFLIVLGVTLFVWTLRGIGILTFIPGSVLWLLFLLCIIAAVVSTLP